MLDIYQICQIYQYFRINCTDKQVKHFLIMQARLSIWKPQLSIQILENRLDSMSQFWGLVMLQAEKLSSHIGNQWELVSRFYKGGRQVKPF